MLKLEFIFNSPHSSFSSRLKVLYRPLTCKTQFKNLECVVETTLESEKKNHKCAKKTALECVKTKNI